MKICRKMVKSFKIIPDIKNKEKRYLVHFKIHFPQINSKSIARRPIEKIIIVEILVYIQITTRNDKI